MGKVVGLISSTRCAAPVTTHWLKVLGKGSMGNGIKVVYFHGFITGGLVVTALVSCALAPFVIQAARNSMQEKSEVACDEEVESV